jgi:hypothetical protein
VKLGVGEFSVGRGRVGKNIVWGMVCSTNFKKSQVFNFIKNPTRGRGRELKLY